MTNQATDPRQAALLDSLLLDEPILHAKLPSSVAGLNLDFSISAEA
jgi:hypothetical protein